MLAHGLEKTLVATGSDENAIVVRKGATSEIMSLLDRNTVNVIKSRPELARDSEGAPIAAAEAVTLIHLPKRNGDQASLVLIRGVSHESLQMRPRVRVTAGRMFQAGRPEVIVGARMGARIKGLALGGHIRFAMQDWTVVGLFEAGGSGFESEIWMDGVEMTGALRRPVYSSITVRLSSPDSFLPLKTQLESDPRFTVEVKREKQYYSDQSEITATFIRVLGLFVTIIFSLGAMIGAMITMYAAVANRTTEIGTLRAMGFSRRSILIGFVSESILLSLMGGGAGLVLASFLQTLTFSTMNFSTFSELAFRFALSPRIAANSILFALTMGLLGGFLPALRAARLNIVLSLRAT